MPILAITSDPQSVASLTAAGLGEVTIATTLADGLTQLRERRWQLVLLEAELEDGSALALLPRITATQPRVVLMSRCLTLGMMIDALKQGAMDVLPLPAPLRSVRELLGRCRAPVAPAHTGPTAAAATGSPLIGESMELLSALRVVARVAPTAATILVQGESGTGKELMARLIHEHSQRAAGPFVAINCAAVPEGLLESELFGCEKGAFTGAHARRIGRIERASGGTLFLDEIGDMNPALQAKLLRVLQEREVERVGGDRPVPVDVRLIAATHHDLAREVEEGSFREDLYYRLAVVELRLPPLRERGSDISMLAQYFVARFAGEHGRSVTTIADETVAILRRHPWPGNIRQLRNVLERAVLLADGPVLLPSHLPAEVLDPGAPRVNGVVVAHAPVALDELVRSHILRTLATTGGHLARTADLLKIHRNTLRRKLQEYGVAAEPEGTLPGDEEAYVDAPRSASASGAGHGERVRHIRRGSELGDAAPRRARAGGHGGSLLVDRGPGDGGLALVGS